MRYVVVRALGVGMVGEEGKSSASGSNIDRSTIRHLHVRNRVALGSYGHSSEAEVLAGHPFGWHSNDLHETRTGASRLIRTPA